LIAAGLRSAGIRTCAKTTGTLPRFIRPDGTEEAIQRVGRTNVIEQVHIIRQAADLNAEAIVLECMALHPLLQSLCELDIVRATHGVITNARPDHLDVMGPTPADVARALSGTVPVSGTLFTAERDPRQLRILEKAARDRNSQCLPISNSDVANITAAERQTADSIINKLREVAGLLGLVMGLGNIAGVGMELVDMFRSRSQQFVPTLTPRKEAA
jgi:poly-gamma-glutamate synthase PgsB/CapB